MPTWSVERKVLAGFAVILAALVMVGALAFNNMRVFVETNRLVLLAHQELETLHALLATIYRVEAGQRGYFISGKQVYLDDRNQAMARVENLADELKRLTRDNPELHARALELDRLIGERRQVLGQFLDLYHAQGFEETRKQFGVGPRIMARILETADRMEQTVRGLLDARLASEERHARQARQGLVGAGVLLLGFLGFGVARVRRDMAERRQAQDSLRVSEATLQQILDLLPVGVFVADPGGAIARVNPAGRRIWGGSNDFRAERLGDFKAWHAGSGEELALEDWGMARALRHGEATADEELEIPCADGSRKIILYTSVPLRDTSGRITGAVATNMDVTSLKRTERELRAAARFDETQSAALALFNASFDRGKILDGLLALLARNHPFPVSALYGYEEWDGKFHCAAAWGLPADMVREFALGEGVLGQSARSGHAVVLDVGAELPSLTLQTGVGDFQPAAVMICPISYQERRIGVLVLAAARRLGDNDRHFVERLCTQIGVALHNLKQYGDLKLLAEQLRRSSEEIAVKNQHLEQASRMKSDFLANMSHELRTPLNAIIGFSEVLRDGLMGELAPKQKEYVGDIFDSGQHLLSLINDILDLSKVEAGKMRLELEPIAVEALVQASLQVVKEKMLAHKLRLSLEIEPDLGELWLDVRKARQILFNLLSNAVKFTPDGGEISLSARRVGDAPLTERGSGDYLQLVVRDKGIGMAAGDLPKLFQPFSQIDGSLSRRYEGTGLGLAMVKRLAEFHGGTVAVESTLGIGSAFTVWLPWRSGPDGSGDTVVVAEPEPPHGEGRALALVVEDDDQAAELLRVQLETAGFRSVRAATAEAALELAAVEKPDVITLDIMLPGMDGWEFLERIKRDGALARVPVVIVSIVADTRRGISLGAAQVLQKPIRREELADALSAIGFDVRDGSRLSVLVVDDDPKAVELIGAYLDGGGYQVLRAYGGQEGIAMARRMRPDLLILDLMMPETNGFDVVEALKDDPETSGIPILVVTAKQVSAEERATLNGHVLRIMEKADFNHGRFLNEVRRAVFRRREE